MEIVSDSFKPESIFARRKKCAINLTYIFQKRRVMCIYALLTKMTEKCFALNHPALPYRIL
jgi:hypothetical protein